MTCDTHLAPAKVNLNLTIHGRRTDGYHELSSVVVFAKDICDRVRFTADGRACVTYSGPTSTPSLGNGGDSVSKVFDSIAKSAADLKVGTVEIEKEIPLAAGLGGGSADAAAVLRAIQNANQDRSAEVNWIQIAQSIGADVPVCVGSTAQFMTGIGERLKPLASFPSLFAVLIKPNITLLENKTGRVFAELKSPTIEQTNLSAKETHVPAFQTAQDVAGYVRKYGNDLSAPARRLMPEIEAPLATLQRDPKCLAASLSGAGPTVFGLFQTRDQAESVAQSVARDNAAWWVRATELM